MRTTMLYMKYCLALLAMFNLSSAFCVDGNTYFRNARNLAEERVRVSMKEVAGNVTLRDITRQPERGTIIQYVTEEMIRLTGYSVQQLRSSKTYTEMFRTVLGDLCVKPVMCSCEVTSSPYRTADGSCNNLINPTWGMASRAQKRLLPPKYSDGIGMPRMYGRKGSMLPSTRLVSNLIHKPAVEGTTDSNATVMVMAYGQFLDHDIIGTPKITESDGTDVNCCQNYKGKFSGPLNSCFTIDVPKDDPHFTQFGIDCINFARSAPAVCEDCNTCYRNQINSHSSYIDASSVYGKTQAEQNAVRSFSKGMLKNIDGLLPKTSDTSLCRGVRNASEHCFLAGDSRVNTVPNLSLLHTIFMAEHNRLAHRLAVLNPHWNDEKLFQETRKIISAQQQNIVYGEYLPVVLGDEFMYKYDLKVSGNVHERSYDVRVDATLSNSFGVASFRFGHASIPNHQRAVSSSYNTSVSVPIETTYHNPHFMHVHQSAIGRWLSHDEATPTDGLFERGVRDLLFLTTNHTSMDLAAVNIQRGRDHGIPPYNDWREYCGLDKITEGEFQATGTPFKNHKADASDAFRTVYEHPDDIDLFSGAMREIPVLGGQVGPTFACLLGRDFRRLKVGDRFFFENPPVSGEPMIGFSSEQAAAIKSQRFAQVVCINTDTPKIQANVFRPPCPYSNPLKDCETLTDIDLEPWKE